MQQNFIQAGDKLTNEDQAALSFATANPHERPSHGGNACVSGWYGAVNPYQCNINGQPFFTEAPRGNQSPQASNSNVVSRHGTGYLTCFTGPVASNRPRPSTAVTARNSPGYQNGHGSLGFNPNQDRTNGQGTLALGFDQESPNDQGSPAFNSDQAGLSGHRSTIFDSDKSRSNDHESLALNCDQADPSSQASLVLTSDQADPSGQGSLALNSEQAGPNNQGFFPLNSDQAGPSDSGPSIDNQIANIFDLTQTHILDNPASSEPITVEDMARDPAATLQGFLCFQQKLERLHALALEKVRNDHAIALQEAHYHFDVYRCRMHATIEYLQSDHAAQAQTIRDFKFFLEYLNHEMSNRGLPLFPPAIHSTPIAHAPVVAGGQMGVQHCAVGQNGTVPPRNGNAAGLMNITGHEHAAQPSAAAGGFMMVAQPNAGNPAGQTRIGIGNGAGQMNTVGQPQVVPRPYAPGPQRAPRPLLPGQTLVSPGPSLPARHALSTSPTNNNNKRTHSEMPSAAPERKKLAL